MRLTSVSIRDIGDRDVAAWNSFAARAASPYLTYDFACAVEDAREGVQVLIAEDGSGPQGYMAFERANGVARPVGAPMSDHQGFASAAALTIDARRVLDALNAGVFAYENWSGAGAPGRVRERAGSTVIDVSEGGAAWFERARPRSKDHFKKAERRLRRAEREFGPARIVFGDPDGARFETLKRWKSAQYRATGKLDLFALEWVETLTTRLAAARFGRLKSLVASLYLGDDLAAVEFGLVSEGVYHSWFPAYDARFAAVSPGLQLLHGVIQESAPLGLQRIDLGKSDGAYKKHYADFEVPLAQGRALAPGVTAAGVAAWETAEALARVLPGKLSTAPVKLRRRWAQTCAFERCSRRRLALMGEAVAGAMSPEGRRAA